MSLELNDKPNFEKILIPFYGEIGYICRSQAGFRKAWKCASDNGYHTLNKDFYPKTYPCVVVFHHHEYHDSIATIQHVNKLKQSTKELLKILEEQ